MPELKNQSRKALLRKAELLWKLVTTTSGVADLAEPMKRAEYHFDRLTKGQKTTVALIADQLDRGFHVINSETENEGKVEGEVKAIEPNAIIPPNQDDSGTGD